ncbi:MAG TPA: patatin-like phospholipase family protein [Burkholderiaceae bacterium]
MKSTPEKHRIALVLQGGGALGAYQAGIYQSLHENDLAPDWVVGTSIGAINAALIAGNPPATRIAHLKEFWDRISHKDIVNMERVSDETRHYNTLLATIDATVRGVPGFYSPRMFSMFPFGLTVPPEMASFYDTTPLAKTLSELIDLEYLNADGGIRLTVNAMKITSGQLVSFDSEKQTLGIEHIMASGALPPAFPPIRIEGELYWDGGLYSNTPLETVLNDSLQIDTLCFMVDLWNATGPEPTSLDHVQTRQKDVMYASRSQRQIEAYLRLHEMQHNIRELYRRIPDKEKTHLDKKMMAEMGCDTTIHIVRLPYGGQDWHMPSKDINFSKGSLEWRWEQGYNDATRAIQHAEWLAKTDNHTGVIVHELPKIVHSEK